MEAMQNEGVESALSNIENCPSEVALPPSGSSNATRPQIHVNECHKSVLNAETVIQSPMCVILQDLSELTSKRPKLELNENFQQVFGSMMNMAIEKLRRVTKKHYLPKDDVDMSKFDNLPGVLQEIHPTIYLTDFYEGRLVPKDDEYNPTCRDSELVSPDKKVLFKELVSSCKKHRFTSIIGYPGAGKTTLSKRLARALSQTSDFLVLRLLFMEMPSFDDKFTLKAFLLGDDNYNLNEEEQSSAFDWIRSNSDKCFIIIDGFDQVSWTIKENTTRFTFKSELSCQEIVSLLCQGKLLPLSHLIFTSRPHKMIGIPKRCRPQRTYFIHDLTLKNMKQLFNYLVNNKNKANEMWEALVTKAPHLKSMCCNPLILQLYVRASFDLSQETRYITTMTGIFHAILENLQASNHVMSLSDTIVKSLFRIAYQATDKGTVLVTVHDLNKENLTIDEVQDLVVTLSRSNKQCGLFEGNRCLYFTHQTFQEYFSTLYITSEMTLKEFESFVRNNILIGHWTVVIQFLSGILFDQDRNDELSKKKQFFLQELIEQTKRIAKRTTLTNVWDSISICKISRECNNKEMINKVASCFGGGYMDISYIPLAWSDVYAITTVIKAIPDHLKSLAMNSCSMDSEMFDLLSEAIRKMPGSIGLLNIRTNSLSNIDSIIAILHKVKECIFVEDCFNDGNEKHRCANSDECSLLQEALDRTENTELKIDIGGSTGYVNISRILKHKNRLSSCTA